MDERKIQTYSEIYCLLNYFPESYLYKIPKKLLDLIKQNSDSKYFIEIDINKHLEEQNISKDTKDMLVVLKYNYWSTEEEQKNIREKLQYNENKYQEELREKYNTDNLFKNKKEEIKENIEEKQLVKIKSETFFKKIINKIKRFLHMENK